MNTADHPNAQLHQALLQAALQRKLTPEFIQQTCGTSTVPTTEHNSSAYVNWNTTVALLGKAPAKTWFAGVSKPASSRDQSLVNLKKSNDALRDDLSVGVYYWWTEVVLPETGYFTVDVFEKENILFIDVFDYKSGKLVALFDGTPTMNVQIRGGRFSFEGNGLWGRDNLNK